VVIGGISVQLPQSEYEVLRVLQQHRGTLLTATVLERALTVKWCHKVSGEYARITLAQLKKRLKYVGLPGDRLIRTAYGHGYYWVEPGEEAASQG
jgi:DNA-binding response OmpR family regulator